jgi:hypothetical protein
MAEDFFGVDRTVTPSGSIATSELGTISLNNGANLTLVQSVTWQYQQQVNPMFEAGSPTLYLVQGQSQGNVDVTRAVGDGGLGTQLKAASGCGVLIPVTIGLDGTGCANISGKNALKFGGGVARQYGGSISTQGLSVTENLSIFVSSLTLAGGSGVVNAPTN